MSQSDAADMTSPWPVARDFQRTTDMTIELFYLTAQIHRWLNLRVARHLETQAQRLAR